ncbi:MAG: hypothetical protein GQ542_15945 [Desulforhopalus sp.]|nr:hypothetical protein [Desulforhopalus sp.]
MTGIAGGVKKEPERQLGDVIVAEEIVGYEPSRITDGDVIRRFDVFRPAFDLISTAKKIKPESWALSTHVKRPDGKTGRVIPNVHFGVVASGEKVIADNDFVNDLQTSWSRLAAVEMEGYGAALAA